ncbi:ABC transporter permease [Maribacter algicola]|uniref:ABC transporter permease n=1 Tax=Meishania litoralis TaxID=3434685 RepID=A0ACC7LJL1_9FLAO
MLKNYLKIGWRNLMKDKTFTLLNVIGLSIAFGAAILLAMSAFFDMSYDKFHANGDQIYQVYDVAQTPRGQEAGTSQPEPFAEALRTEVPGVEKITRYLQDGGLVIYGEKEIDLNTVWVDADFFSMFTFPVLKGNEHDPLQDQASVVITESAANKLFGNEEAIGQTINIMINGKEEPFTVGSVVGNVPPQSSLEFEVAVRFEKNAEYADTKGVWDSQYHGVYVQLPSGVSAERFEKNARSFTELHYKESMEAAKRDGAMPDADGLYRQLKLLPLKDLHFTGYRKGYAEVSRSVPYLILGVAFLILFIACVNFVNMSIAKSAQRLREIGMRKTLGAQKGQLFFQFWSESLFVFLSSMGIGVLLSILLIDDFKSMFRTRISLDMLAEPWAVFMLLATILTITLTAGGYPALLFSRLGTIQSLKGKLEASGNNLVRNALMVVQFGIAILLISGTLVLWGQVQFMRNKDLGYNKEQVISFPLNGKKNGHEVLRLLKDELNGNPDILEVSASDNNLGRGKDGSQWSSAIGFEHKGRNIRTNALTVDYNYISTLGLQMAQGRDFKSEADSLGVLINEAMARQLEEKDPLSARLEVGSETGLAILGVVKDYNFQGLDRAIEPITFFMGEDMELRYAYVKVAPENMASSFDAIEQTWKKLEPNAEFLGSFLDENVDRTFQREKTMATMITSGSIIAIALSCIGLFAMSLLIVAQRTKEIGVRKVLGASVASITVLLTKDFLKLVLIAFLIASPIAWWFSDQWLQNYTYKIDLGVWFFVAAGLLAMVIALLTVGTRTVSAAAQNPVKSLRTE